MEMSVGAAAAVARVAGTSVEGVWIMDSLGDILTFLPRLFLFVITFPLRFLGLDFDWGIR
jgi:hypothetical protein